MGYFDQFYSSSEAPQASAPMDAGPAFQWGADPALSGSSSGMFSGQYQSQSPMDFGPASQWGGPQQDMTITTAAYNAGSPLGEGQVVEQTPEEPSFFKKLFSGALLGLGTGAGAPDAGSAFAMGFQGILQQRELERKNAMEDAKFKQDMKMQQVQMDSMIVDKMYREKQYDFLDEDQKMKMKSLEDQEFQLYSQFGTPLATNVEDTDENRQKLMEQYGSNLVSSRDGKLFVFKPTGKLEQDYYMQIPNADGTMQSVLVGRAGDSIAQVAPFMNTQIQQAFQAEENEKNRRNQFAIAQKGYDATIKSMEQRRQYNDPMLENALDPIDKALIKNYEEQTKVLSDTLNRDKEGTLARLKAQNAEWQAQKAAILQSYQGGGAPKTTSGGFTIQGNMVIGPNGEKAPLNTPFTTGPNKGKMITGVDAQGNPTWAQAAVSSTSQPGSFGNFMSDIQGTSNPQEQGIMDTIVGAFEPTKVNTQERYAQFDSTIESLKRQGYKPEQILQYMRSTLGAEAEEYAKMQLTGSR